jgi:serine/threonine-protein kinase
VPSVKGLSEEDARKRLSGAGFNTVVVGEPIETKDCKNKVEDQSPAATTSLPVNQTVTINMCSSPETVRVPSDLVGRDQEFAKSTLEGLGLDPKFDKVNSSEPEGRVLEVEKEGDQVPRGTDITVRVSRGNLVQVPSVEGKPVDVARALLQEKGFTRIVINETDQDGEPGTVVDQVPGARKSVPTSTTITLTVISERTPDPGGSGTPDPGGSTPPGGDGGGTGEDGTGGLLD